jgi:hypothetical protein
MELTYFKDYVPTGWDERLHEVGAEAGLGQSTYWARVIQRIDQINPFFLEVVDNQQIIVSLLMFHKYPWNRHEMRKQIGLRELISGTWRGWLEWFDGPVIHTQQEEKIKDALHILLTWLEKYAYQHRVAYISGSMPQTGRVAANTYIADIFLERDFTISTWATYLVDLSQNEADLWRNLQKSARKNIKKAKSLGVRIKHISLLKTLEKEFYIPYCAIENAAGRSSPPFSTFEISWTEDQKQYYHYYVAESETGEILATLGMYIFNNVATEIASALSPKAVNERIPAQDLLHWEMFLTAKKLGCHTFNLAGVNPKPNAPKEEGILRFKKKWGGQYVEYHRFEKVMLINRLWRTAQSTSKKFKGLFKPVTG